MLRQRLWDWMWIAYLNARYHHHCCRRYQRLTSTLNAVTIAVIMLGFAIGVLYTLPYAAASGWVKPLSMACSRACDLF